jgi:hypothetical protein
MVKIKIGDVILLPDLDDPVCVVTIDQDGDPLFFHIEGPFNFDYIWDYQKDFVKVLKGPFNG